jgi:hypothetical protein
MGREKMVGENLRDGDMEVAFELWIERMSNLSRLQRNSTVIKGSDIGASYCLPYCNRVQRIDLKRISS